MPDDLRAALERAWRRSDALFGILRPGALRARPIRLRQPFVFYVGHLPAFAWNQVCRGLLGRPSFRADFDALFERGIDPLDEGNVPAEAAWPGLDEIHAYRDRVRTLVRDAFDEVSCRRDGDVLAEGGRIFHIVLEHELMHHETLLYMMHELAPELKVAPGDVPPVEIGLAVEQETITVPAGEALLGADFESVPFGWDNEFPTHRVMVPAFEIDRRPVTNGDFLEFVESGAYDERTLWPEGEPERHQPVTWSGTGDTRRVRTMFASVPLADAGGWPVQVSWNEARAYCVWRGARLPTEAEYHRAAFGTPEGGTREHPWGDAPPGREQGNFGFAQWAPLPAGSRAGGASAWGVDELVGNGWEWTGSDFAPYPGYDVWHRTYPGYSKDFFDGCHAVLLGGSWATDAALLRPSFRNWFQRRYPYVFSKFRCCRDAR